ncbi:MAG: insulinase family protein [Planctomycetes bacterium]|nr:insulinase family protein [Planctomycetota bacterium]
MAPRLLRAVLAGLSFVATLSAQSGDVFTFPWAIRDFDNGLRLVTVTTSHPGIVSVHCVVSVGSRHEVEPGKSGFAHFFEHMMFRGTKNLTSAEQAAIFKAAGADRNAYTNADFTNYHTTVPTEELDTVLRLEADRFRNLRYSEKDFRTEAMAVYGEYNKNSSNPVQKLFEVVQETAFDAHPYRHTTMGFLADIRAMPRQFDYSLQFFDRFYRPENVTLLVVGDVQAADVEARVARYWGDWQRGSFVASIPAEPAQLAPRDCHVKWPVATQPWVAVVWKGPAFSTRDGEMAALDLLSQVAFAPTSSLYQRLFVEEGVVDVLQPHFPDQTDPGLLWVMARVRDPQRWAYVRDAILAECRRWQDELVDDARLAAVKSHQRYAFANALDSSAAIADVLAAYLARARTPDAVNLVHRRYAAITPADLREAARKYFVTEHRTIATLSHEPLPEAVLPGEPAAAPAGVFLPSASPLVAIRLVYPTGAIDDPAGKEGLTAVTARMLTDAATQRRGYQALTDALHPMAAGFAADVDEEMTVLSGAVHADMLDAYWSLFREAIREPAFLTADLERIRALALAELELGLRQSDDEELGKEVLLTQLFAGHPYGSLNQGTLEGLRAITIDDVRACWEQRFRAPIVGLAGGHPADFAARVHREIGGAAQVPAPRRVLAEPAALARSRMTIVQKPTRATGLHLGFHLDVDRGHADWVALWLATSWLGQHRSEISHLYQRLRELRGLNYGDYAYVEYFPNGGRSFQPPPNHARQHAVFSIWIRPVPHENGPFALKAAWFELDRLVREGLTAEQFEAMRGYLRKSCAMLTATDDRRLGYALDQAYHGLPDWVDFVREGLDRLTVDDVNRAIRAHLRSDRLQFVVVTDDAARFREAILGDAPTPIVYQAKPAQDVLDEDARIEKLSLGLRDEDVITLPIDAVFRR